VPLDENDTDPLEIARKELAQKKIPLIVRRFLPDGSYEDWTWVSQKRSFLLLIFGRQRQRTHHGLIALWEHKSRGVLACNNVIIRVDPPRALRLPLYFHQHEMSDLLAEIKRLQTEIALEHQQMESLPDAPTTAPSSPLRDSASAKKPAPTASAATAGTRDDYESMQHGFQERKQAADAIMNKVPPYA
jgi:hypothetical protein